jgi:glycolate oxidase
MSEIVLKTEYMNKEQTILVASLTSREDARDIADSLTKLEPASLEIIDSALFKAAVARGKSYSFIDTDTVDGAVIYVQWNDFSDAARARKLKKAVKILGGRGAMITTSDDVAADELRAVRTVTSVLYGDAPDGHSFPPLIDGAQIPTGRQEEFAQAVYELAAKHHVELPLHIRALDGTVFTRPSLQLDKVADKQKVFKLINDYAVLVEKYGGHFVADGSEGRLKANAAYSVLEEDVRCLYNEIRAIFDPFGTLNPGVKQSSDIKDLVHALRPDYDTSDFAQYSPHN